MKRIQQQNMVHITNRPPLNSEGGVVQILGKGLGANDVWVSPYEEKAQPNGIITTHENFDFSCMTFDRPQQHMKAHYYNISLGLFWPFKHELTDEVRNIVTQMGEDYNGDKTRALKENMIGYDAHMRYSNEMLAKANLSPDITVAHDFTCAGIKSPTGMNVFTDHTPFPNKKWIDKMMKDTPSLKQAGFLPYYLNTVCSYDLITMHTPEDCGNMAKSLQKYAPDYQNIDRGLSLYRAFGHEVSIQCVPVGLNPEHIEQEAEEASFDQRISGHLNKTIERNVILSVARNDFTKGTMEYVDVIDNFFTQYPERINDTTFLVYRSPSRKGVSGQQDYQEVVGEKMAHLMEKYPKGVIYDSQGIPHPQLMKLMQQPQIKIITSLPTTREGHDLTVREFVDVNPHNSDKAVVLSENVGARVVFGVNAFLVNDCRDGDIGKHINYALTHEEETRQRFNLMKDASTLHSGPNYLKSIKGIVSDLQNYRNGQSFSFTG